MCHKFLTLNNITYTIKKKAILDNISLNIKNGEILAIIGPNGAGKSTLANIIAGIVKDYAGDVIINNQNIKHMKKREKAKIISYVPQHYSYSVADFLVQDFVLSGRYPYLDYFGNFKKEKKKKSDYYMEKSDYYMEITGVYHLRDRHISSLSGGEKQRVNIAAALTQEAEYIILDEITSSLDLKGKHEINSLLLKLNKDEGKTIILITHDLHYALSYNLNFIALKNGKLFFQGNGAEVIGKNILPKLFDIDIERFNEYKY